MATITTSIGIGYLPDSVGGANGTLNNLDASNFPADVPSGIGSTASIDFNGTDEHVDIPELTFTGTFSISFWMKPDTYDTNFRSVVAHTTKPIKIGKNNSSSTPKFFVRVLNGGSSDTTVDMPTAGVWSHVVLTRDSSNKVDLYVNNSSANRLFSDVAQTGSSDWDNIGMANPNQYWAGGIDDLRFYDDALTAAEVEYLYTGGSTGSDPGSGNLTNYYKFQDVAIRDYSTITAWEADLDNGGVYSSSDDAVGECYNDAVFDENVTINGGTTVGLNSVTLSVAESERHDGTAGTGARINRTSAYTTIVQSAASYSGGLWVEWLEIDGNGNGAQNSQCVGQTTAVNSTDRTKQVYANLLVHPESSSNRFIDGIDGINRPFTALNCIVYNVISTGASGSDSTWGIGGDDKIDAINCTVHNVSYANSIGIVRGIDTNSNVGGNVINCLVTNLTGGSGTNECIDGTSTKTTSATSDTTGTSGLQSITTADQYVSTVLGSEDLHLKAGADAIDAATNLGSALFASGTQIIVPDDDTLSFGNSSTDSAFSGCAWIYTPNVTSTSEEIFSKADTNATLSVEYRFRIINGTVQIILHDSLVNNRIRCATDNPISANTLTHVAFTYDGSGSETGLTLYVDGVAVAQSQSSTGTYTAMDNTASTFNIGSIYTTTDYFTGYISDVQIHSTELSSTDIANIIAGSTPTGNLVSRWLLDEGASADTAVDSAGSNNGTIDDVQFGYSTDINGYARLPSEDWDIGAHEFQLADVTFSATLLSSTFSVLAPTPEVGVTTTLLTSSFSIFAPTIVTGGSVTVTPTLLTSSFSVQTPTPIVTYTDTISTAAFSVLTPTLSIGGAVTVVANLLTSSFSVQAPTLEVTKIDTVSTSAFSVQAPTPQVIFADTLQTATFSVQAPVVIANVTFNHTLQTATFSVFAPSITTGNDVTYSHTIVTAAFSAGTHIPNVTVPTDIILCDPCSPWTAQQVADLIAAVDCAKGFAQIAAQNTQT